MEQCVSEMEGFENLKKLIHCDNYLTESDGPGAFIYIEIYKILISRVFFTFQLGMNIILISRVFFSQVLAFPNLDVWLN